MEITIGRIIGWVVAGMLAGSVAGILVKRRREGFGRWSNLGLGLVGGLVGGALFEILGIDIARLQRVSVSLQDLLAAFLGSLLFLLVIWWIQRRRPKG